MKNSNEYYLTKESATLFENIKHIDENGVEFWYGRELAPHLGYTQWRNFESVIEKAKEACKSATGTTENDFANVSKIVKAGATEKPVQDFKLTRYACYLVAQNGNSKKKEIAEAQTYFAIQTRYAEIQQMQEYQRLTTEEEMRLFLRRQMREHNAQLADAANNAGVREPWQYAKFQNEGYKGLYGGLDEDAIHSRKGLGPKEKILDHMGSAELAANLFRATQAEQKLTNENIKGIENANRIHREIGQKVREAIKEIGGVMPEDLPTVENIRQLEKKEKSLEKFKQAIMIVESAEVQKKTKEALLQAWKDTAEIIKGDMPRLHSFMTKSEPIIDEDNDIVVEFNTSAQVAWANNCIRGFFIENILSKVPGIRNLVFKSKETDMPTDANE